jgi:hypothetical protein
MRNSEKTEDVKNMMRINLKNGGMLLAEKICPGPHTTIILWDGDKRSMEIGTTEIKEIIMS